jgi:predicted nucleic acid-binding Zn ribbon protein
MKKILVSVGKPKFNGDGFYETDYKGKWWIIKNI